MTSGQPQFPSFHTAVPDASVSLADTLDWTLERMICGETALAMESLVNALHRVRSHATEARWKNLVEEVCRSHRLFAVLQQDPFTARSYLKPRGYAGDAVMMDMIYGIPTGEAVPASSRVGGRIHSYITESGRAPRAVRYRRWLIANYVDSLCARSNKPRVLSVAAGHLREAQLSAAARNGSLREWVALDHDGESLAECQRSSKGLPVSTRQCSVRDILRGKLAGERFEFVYAAGLFDYLGGSIAQALAGHLFEVLKPGGQLLVANFLSDNPEAGYMEAFMDWWLYYRSPQEVRGLFDALTGHLVSEIRVFTDPFLAVAYAICRKADHTSGDTAGS